MGTFTPIAMKCTREQFEAIKPKLEGVKIEIGNFEKLLYLCNNLDGYTHVIANIFESCRKDYNRTVYETWNEEIFLKACGIEVNSLEQQLQKAEAEVKRLQSLIEEENNIKIGDWVKRNYNGIEIFKADATYDYRYINSEKSLYKKITNPELINLLENE